jgi:hypothetical protein
MTYTSQASQPSAGAAFAQGDFRVGQVISRAFTLLFRHFLTFFIVTLIAFSPMLLLSEGSAAAATDPAQAFITLGLGFVLLMVLSMFSSAIILHGAFQDMRNRPVNVLESLKVAFRRLLPLILLALLESALLVLGLILLIVPGLILYTMWLVAVAACVVERTGPWRSLRRSQELTTHQGASLENLRAVSGAPPHQPDQPGAATGVNGRSRRDRGGDRQRDLDRDRIRVLLGGHRGHLLRAACRQGRHRHRADRLGVRLGRDQAPTNDGLAARQV